MGAIVSTKVTTAGEDDREFDALVAERVFECHAIRYSKLSVGCGCADEPHARGGDELKPFSGNMNDAMLVVEKMREQDFVVKIVGPPDSRDWIAFFWKQPDDDSRPTKFWKSGKSLARAICEAALAALSATWPSDEPREG